MASHRQRIVDELGAQGFSFFTEEIWSSAISPQDLDVIRTFLHANRWDNIDVSVISPQDGATTRIRWDTYYNMDGQCLVVPVETPILPSMMFLRLVFGYREQQQRDSARPREAIVTSSLRLIFGIPVARELVLTSHFSSDNQNAGHFSEIGYASLFDGQDINVFNSPPIGLAKIKRMTADAAILIDKAFTQKFPTERFVLLWSAFEAVTHELPYPGTNGKKRQKFYQGELGSDLANSEIIRLFNIRNQLFKEGMLEETHSDEASWSLYAALQLMILEAGEQRRSFLMGYEAYIRGKLA